MMQRKIKEKLEAKFDGFSSLNITCGILSIYVAWPSEGVNIANFGVKGTFAEKMWLVLYKKREKGTLIYIVMSGKKLYNMWPRPSYAPDSSFLSSAWVHPTSPIITLFLRPLHCGRPCSCTVRSTCMSNRRQCDRSQTVC